MGPWLIAVALAAVWTVLPDPAAAQGTAPHRGRALLVAIDQYRDSRLNLPPESSATDAKTIRDLLIGGMGYDPANVRLLINEQASKAGILAAIDEWLIAGTRPGDPAFFSYSGHGAQQRDTNGDEEDGLDETLVAWDTEIRPDRTIVGMLADDELEAKFAQLADRQVTMLVDACHSGTISRSAIPVDAEPSGFLRTPLFEPFLSQATGAGASLSRSAAVADDFIEQRGKEESFLPSSAMRTVWTAVTPTQVALVERGTDPPQGVFTRRFAAAVKDRTADRNGNGILSYAEVLDYVRTQSQAYCERERDRDCRANGGNLTPTLEAAPEALGRDIVTGAVASSVSQQATDTFGQGNANGLRIDIAPSATARLGDKVQFRITSAETGYLLVIDINAANDVVQLFPNQFSQQGNIDNMIRAGQPLTLPEASYGFDFVAQPPTGDGVLLAIVTRDRVDLSSLTDDHRGFAPVARAQTYLSAVAQRLISTWADRLQSRGVRWSMAHAPYSIAN